MLSGHRNAFSFHILFPALTRKLSQSSFLPEYFQFPPIITSCFIISCWYHLMYRFIGWKSVTVQSSKMIGWQTVSKTFSSARQKCPNGSKWWQENIKQQNRPVNRVKYNNASRICVKDPVDEEHLCDWIVFRRAKSKRKSIYLVFNICICSFGIF